MIAFVREQEKAYQKKQVDQDGLWKKVIEELFEEFLLFLCQSCMRKWILV